MSTVEAKPIHDPPRVSKRLRYHLTSVPARRAVVRGDFWLGHTQKVMEPEHITLSARQLVHHFSHQNFGFDSFDGQLRRLHAIARERDEPRGEPRAPFQAMACAVADGGNEPSSRIVDSRVRRRKRDHHLLNHILGIAGGKPKLSRRDVPKQREMRTEQFLEDIRAGRGVC